MTPLRLIIFNFIDISLADDPSVIFSILVSDAPLVYLKRVAKMPSIFYGVNEMYLLDLVKVKRCDKHEILTWLIDTYFPIETHKDSETLHGIVFRGFFAWGSMADIEWANAQPWYIEHNAFHSGAIERYLVLVAQSGCIETTNYFLRKSLCFEPDFEQTCRRLVLLNLQEVVTTAYNWSDLFSSHDIWKACFKEYKSDTGTQSIAGEIARLLSSLFVWDEHIKAKRLVKNLLTFLPLLDTAVRHEITHQPLPYLESICWYLMRFDDTILADHLVALGVPTTRENFGVHVLRTLNWISKGRLNMVEWILNRGLIDFADEAIWNKIEIEKAARSFADCTSADNAWAVIKWFELHPFKCSGLVADALRSAFGPNIIL